MQKLPIEWKINERRRKKKLSNSRKEKKHSQNVIDGDYQASYQVAHVCSHVRCVCVFTC